jgi:CheY-like chemotaxis protein
MKRILVVDDEKDVELLFRQHFRKAINENRLVFQFAFSGRQALDLIGDRCDPELMMFTDINMPGMDGIELLRQVKTQCPQTKVFMISAYDRSDYRIQAEKFGAEEFIPKPVDFTLLKQKIENATI